MNKLQINNICKSFDDNKILNNISCEVNDGEILAILGPSGCGKSTLLKIIAGLIKPDSGNITWDNNDISSIPTHQRGFGLMFQDYALFPHMNVFNNIAFGLEMLKLDKNQIKDKVLSTLELVGLIGFENRDVNELSGGEQQRVALARSIVPQPNLLMLDEPLGSLDKALRERLLKDLTSILDATSQTTIYVTHDQEEAYTIADKIIILNKGEIMQRGTPSEIYNHPANIFVAKFLGMKNIFEVNVKNDSIELPIGKVIVSDSDKGASHALVRADRFSLKAEYPNSFTGRMVDLQVTGDLIKIEIAVGEQSIHANINSTDQIPEVGSELTLYYDPERSIQFIGAD